MVDSWKCLHLGTDWGHLEANLMVADAEMLADADANAAAAAARSRVDMPVGVDS